MKILNVIRAKTPVSDTVTDDPISQSGQSNIKMFFECISSKFNAKTKLYA